MGRQSQLGPIDPQIFIPGSRSVSARSIVDQFNRAKLEVVGDPNDPSNPGDLNLAHVWAPVLQSVGPALLQEAQNVLDYGERMVAEWMKTGMLAGQTDAEKSANDIAQHFNDASQHKSHGRRIDRDEARSIGVVVDDLEDDQALQDAVLTAYHMMMITFNQTPACKLIFSNYDRMYVNNAQVPAQTG